MESYLRIWRIIGYMCALFVTAWTYQPTSPGDPIADPNAVLIIGNARFTILTDALVRLEYSPTGPSGFNDDQTIVRFAQLVRL
jgi:hypothetical protein